MKVSIVTISYNQAAFLEQTIRSVIEQDYPNIEYIIVDPGSTDGSREIIEKYRSKISLVIFEPDMGPADGLNKGFHHATGDIFGYLNSDDYYLPTAITKVINYFHNHPDIDIVSGNAHIVGSSNNFIRFTYSDKFSLLACAYGFSNLIQPSSFFRKEIYNKTNGFNIRNGSNWDDELFIDMKVKGGNFGRINEFLSAYRIYKKNITGSGLLHKKIIEYKGLRFNKILGRKRRFVDSLVSPLFRIRHYVTNTRDLYQRMKFGPIYRRYSSNMNEKE